MALKDGLLLADSIGCNRLIICSDNSEVIGAMKKYMHASGSVAAVLNDCYFMSSEFANVVFKHEFVANVIAHE